MANRIARGGVRSIALLAAAVLPLAASMAGAQYRVDNGSSRDANNRLGSGGYNDASAGGRIGGLAGNYIVTGNVTGGRSFRGALGYTDPSAFRGNVGSASFDNFIRDSTGTGTIRGDYSRANYATVQPYFGAGQTAAVPPGFARSMSYNGAYTPRSTLTVQPNDARIDYGGATGQQVAQSYLADQRAIGGAGLATTYGQQWSALPPQTRPMQLSEFTQLARQSRTGVFGGALTAMPASSDPSLPTNLPGTAAAQPQAAGAQSAGLPDARINGGQPAGNTNGAPGDASTGADARLPGNNVITPGQRPAGAATDAGPADVGNTGQISTIRSTRAADNNAQYAELRSRLGAAATPSSKQLPGSEANAQIQAVNARLVRQRNGNAAQTSGAKPQGDGGAKAGAASPGMPDPNTPNAGATVTAPPDGSSPAASTPAPPDTLRLPRPEGDPAAGPATRPADLAPLNIQSFATGVKDKALAQTLRQAEDLMRAGKFGSAIEAYDRAQEQASDDSLVFMGRSIAELGGSYYRKSELHLREAFAGDMALLGAKFDLRGMLTDARLNFLTNDLGEVARTNPNDPGPILLLAFIYYNGGMEDRATRALDLAQQRAGGNDPVIKLLKERWALSTEPTLNK